MGEYLPIIVVGAVMAIVAIAANWYRNRNKDSNKAS